ncbi:unnamed protein product, partial [Phaeothamnion confervicola]
MNQRAVEEDGSLGRYYPFANPMQALLFLFSLRHDASRRQLSDLRAIMAYGHLLSDNASTTVIDHNTFNINDFPGPEHFLSRMCKYLPLLPIYETDINGMKLRHIPLNLLAARLLRSARRAAELQQSGDGAVICAFAASETAVSLDGNAGGGGGGGQIPDGAAALTARYVTPLPTRCANGRARGLLNGNLMRQSALLGIETVHTLDRRACVGVGDAVLVREFDGNGAATTIKARLRSLFWCEARQDVRCTYLHLCSTDELLQRYRRLHFCTGDEDEEDEWEGAARPPKRQRKSTAAAEHPSGALWECWEGAEMEASCRDILGALLSAASGDGGATATVGCGAAASGPAAAGGGGGGGGGSGSRSGRDGSGGSAAAAVSGSDAASAAGGDSGVPAPAAAAAVYGYVWEGERGKWRAGKRCRGKGWAPTFGSLPPEAFPLPSGGFLSGMAVVKLPLELYYDHFQAYGIGGVQHPVGGFYVRFGALERSLLRKPSHMHVVAAVPPSVRTLDAMAVILAPIPAMERGCLARTVLQRGIIGSSGNEDSGDGSGESSGDDSSSAHGGGGGGGGSASNSNRKGGCDSRSGGGGGGGHGGGNGGGGSDRAAASPCGAADAVAFVRCGIAKIDADAPQRAEFASTKAPSGSSKQPCPYCHVDRTDLTSAAVAAPRTLGETRSAIAELGGLDGEEQRARSMELGVAVSQRQPGEIKINPLHGITFDPHLQLGVDVFHLDAQGKWGQLMEFFLKGMVNSSGLEVLSAVMLDPELYGPGRAVLRDPAQTGMLASLTGMQKWLFAEVSVVVLSRFFAILRQSSAGCGGIDGGVGRGGRGGSSGGWGNSVGGGKGKKKQQTVDGAALSAGINQEVRRRLIGDCGSPTAVIRLIMDTAIACADVTRVLRLTRPNIVDVAQLSERISLQVEELTRLLGKEAASRPNTHFARHVPEHMLRFGLAPETQTWERNHQQLKGMNPSSSGRDVERHYMLRSNVLMALEAMRDGLDWECQRYDVKKRTYERVRVTAGSGCRDILKRFGHLIRGAGDASSGDGGGGG